MPWSRGVREELAGPKSRRLPRPSTCHGWLEVGQEGGQVGGASTLILETGGVDFWQQGPLALIGVTSGSLLGPATWEGGHQHGRPNRLG